MREVTAYLISFGSLLKGDDYQWDGVELAKNNPNGYLVAVILDQGMKAEKVWAIPNKLEDYPFRWNWKRPLTIMRRGIPRIEEDLKAMGCRYWRNMTSYVYKGLCDICRKYAGNAENIWKDTTSAKLIYDRFIEFKGIGQKKASMAVNILARDCGLGVSLHDIDVSYDKHIRQVFLRCGLVEKDDARDIIRIAREENPKYPGALDKPAWYIGRDWCFNKLPDCDHCPLGFYKVCARKTEIIVKERNNANR